MNGAIILEQQPQVWVCPRCPATTRTVGAPNRFHHCAGLKGLLSPMVPAGTVVKVEVHEREDYIGTEDVPLVDGRPIMNVTVTREDGEDVTVYAPTAYLHTEA